MSRSTSHHHALRAALAVTGRARRPYSHCPYSHIVCALMVWPLAACGVDVERAGEETSSWTLGEDAARDQEDAARAEIQDMATFVPDIREAPDAPPDLLVEDAALDASEDDMAESCLDAAGQTDWRCCQRTALTGIGCGFCEERFGQQEPPVTCLSCYTYQNEWSECCEGIDPLVDVEAHPNDPVGCSPWGPSAPPVYRGATLLALQSA